MRSEKLPKFKKKISLHQNHLKPTSNHNVFPFMVVETSYEPNKHKKTKINHLGNSFSYGKDVKKNIPDLFNSSHQKSSNFVVFQTKKQATK